jgi:hypothetical protein
MTISEFEKLTAKELAFIYFFADHRSSYAAYDEEERKKAGRTKRMTLVLQKS